MDYVELIRQALAEVGIAMSEDEVEQVAELARQVRVPRRQDTVKNFIAAYLRVVRGWKAKDADRVASSPKGRRTWEEKLRTTLSQKPRSIRGGEP